MINIDRQSEIPIYMQLYNALKQEILEDNNIKKTLPAIRVLAKELCISKNTVDRVYQQLQDEGYIYSIHGSGFYKNNINQETPEGKIAAICIPQTESTLSVPKYNFQYGNADNKVFSWINWKKCVKNALRYEESAKYLEYEDKQGNYQLRQSLASFLKASRGVVCSPEQIILCSGVQFALDIISILLPSTEYVIGFEEPGYDGTRNVFLRNNYKINPISISDQGISIEELEKSDSNLVYVTPSHQFPMGCVLPITKRIKLLSLMNERKGFVIEDDYDSEFRYGSLAIPSLQSLDKNDRVIYTGTFSKSLSPTLRVAYLILPRQLLPLYMEKFSNTKNSIPSVIQYSLCEFIEKGYYIKHLRKLILANEKKLHTILDLFSEYHSPYIHPIATNCGVHILLKIDVNISQQEFLELLGVNDIKLYPTTHYWLEPDSRNSNLYLMGFASMSLTDIRNGVMHLCKIIPNVIGPRPKK